jgi:hypothetical protein
MSDITDFIDEHDLTAEDVIDALDVDPAQVAEVPDEPTDFYDGQPSVETLSDDFDAVAVLKDEKDKLATENDSLREQVRDAQRPVFADKAERLSELTDRWGDKDSLLAKFDTEDEEERWSVDDIDAKLELVEDIIDEETTTVTDSTDEQTEDTSTPDVPMTDSGRFDLRSERTKIETR